MSDHAETAVAIAEVWFCAREHAHAFYARHGERLHGFPGVWGFIAALARAVDEAHDLHDWSEREFIDYLDHLPGAAMDAMDSLEIGQQIDPDEFLSIAVEAARRQDAP